MTLPTSLNDVARLLDHAILQPTTTDAHLDAEVASLVAYPLATLCVRPCSVARTSGLLAGTRIGVCTVIGFPSGSPATATKVFEARQALADGATELDMVVNVGQVLGENWAYVRHDIASVVEVGHAANAIVKVIFETDFLPHDKHKIRLCEICTEVGADFVKTSTGFGFVKGVDGKFGYRGATEHDVALMRKHAGPTMGIKPSGGIRTLDEVLKFVQLGATRIGTGSSPAILQAAAERFGGKAQSHVVANQGY